MFSALPRRLRFHPRREEGAEEQDGRAPELRRGETLVKNPGRKRERAERAEQLQGLRKRDADLADGDVVEDMRERDAEHRGDDQDPVDVRAGTCKGVSILPKIQVSGKSMAEVRKLMTPKLRMLPSRADGRFTRTP